MSSEQYLFLSRFFQNGMPCYNGLESFSVVNFSSIGIGNKTNSLDISLKNHVGTHIDFPSHFFKDGKTASNYKADFFIFTSPEIVHIPLTIGRYITEKDISNISISQNTDILIFKTDFSDFYKSDKYWNDNPGIDSSVSHFLKNKYPRIRCIGMDFISVNSYKNKEPGRSAHEDFLSDPEILIIEDMDLSKLTVKIKKLIVAPMLIKDADGSPCTVIGVI